jgi:hypothetical protein
MLRALGAQPCYEQDKTLSARLVKKTRSGVFPVRQFCSKREALLELIDF